MLTRIRHRTSQLAGLCRCLGRPAGREWVRRLICQGGLAARMRWIFGADSDLAGIPACILERSSPSNTAPSGSLSC
jgi:hypothetical protein